MREQPPKPYLEGQNLDDLARMNTALLSELWIVRDRLAVLEKLLADRGVVKPGEVDTFVPDTIFAGELENLRDTMVKNVAGAPFPWRDVLAEVTTGRNKP